MPQEPLLHNPTSANAEPDADLVKHIESLGLQSTEEYVSWCACHGFSQRTDKNWRERLKERSFLVRPVADSRLAQQKHEARKPEKIIERIFHGELREEEVSQPALKAVCHAYESSKSCLQTKQAFFRLLFHVLHHADLFSAQPVIATLGAQEGNSFIGGLLALARHSTNWIRLATAWKPQSHNPNRQFSSFVRHLLADWPVPPFMDSVWFKGESAAAHQQQRWFQHIGQGHNIRTAGLPLQYTKKMAHHFTQAPPDYTVEAAIRWGQIHGLGGNARLVRTINRTRLGTDFEQDAFWTTVLQFFIANLTLDPAQIGPIIDYIYHQKFVPQDVFAAPGIVERREPPQPHFDMKGPTPAALLRQVATWHRSLANSCQPQAEWPRSGIEGYEFIERMDKEGTVRIWTIKELTSAEALVAEGREMRHCVATYTPLCLQGARSIWTLDVEMEGKRSKLLTIEVQSESKLICQIRGKCNVLPSERYLGVLRRWAEQAGLHLADQV